MNISLEVQNSGKRLGDEVVQLYLHDKVASVARPEKELKAFQRLSLKAGEAQKIVFQVPVRQLGLYDQKLHFVVEPGEFEVMVGSSSEDIRLTGKLMI